MRLSGTKRPLPTAQPPTDGFQCETLQFKVPTSPCRRHRMSSRPEGGEEAPGFQILPQKTGPAGPIPWSVKPEATSSPNVGLIGLSQRCLHSFRKTDLTCNISVHGNIYRDQRGLTQSDNGPSGSRRPSSVDPNCLQMAQSTAADTKSETSDAPCRSPRPPETASCPIARNPSDASLYIPMRRRSLIQTPGVATRGVTVDPRSPTLPSIQVNHATPATQPTSYDSPAHQIDNHLSLPSSALISEPQARAVTPCEEDYRQLGGMKFGTLRITNGSPVRSPAVEIGNPVARHSGPQPDCSEPERPAHHEPAWPLTKSAILSDKLYSDHNVKIVQPLVSDATHVLSSATCESAPGQNFELELERSWLLDSNEEYAVTATPGPQSTESRSTSDRQSSPDSSENMLERERIDAEYLSPEVLDVREDPSAKFGDNSDDLRSSGEPPGNSMARSDSGFVSTSTSSSTSSQKTLSQADSGYSSNFSLRSIRAGSKKKRRDAEAADPKVGDSLRPSPEYGTRPGKGNQSTSSSRASFAFMSRLSTRAGKNHELQSPVSGVFSKHSRTRSADVETGSHLQETPERLNDSTMGKKEKLHRLLAGSTKRQSFPTAYMSHDIQETIPAVPSDIEEKLREHNGLFPTASKRIALRVESSQETLKTIMSVESLDLADARTQDVDSFREAKLERTLPRQESQHRRQSLSAVPRTQTQESAPSWILAPRASIKRKPIGSRPRMLGCSEEEYCFIPGDARMDAAVGAGSYNGADATVLHIATCVNADALRLSQLQRTLTKPNRKSPAYSSETHTLKSRSSAPDLTDSPTIPPYRTLSQSRLHGSKSPPSTSMKNLSVESSSQQKSSQSKLTSSEAAPSISQRSSQESLHGHQWHPPQVRTRDPSLAAGKQPQIRHSYGGPSRQPPVVFRQPHFRDRSKGSRPHSDGQGQQYRILHSYNSPAYKNAPIWS